MSILSDVLSKITSIKKLRDELSIHLKGMDLVDAGADLENCVRALQRVESHGNTFKTITSPEETVSIESGYYPDGITVGLHPDEAGKIVPASLKTGTTILGVEGTYTSDATATANDILSGETAFVNGSKITGLIPTKGASSIGVNALTVNIPAGYYPNVIKTTLSDVELTASNVKTGVNIFGVTGSYTSDATAGAGDILSDKTAYVNGVKVTGVIPSQGAKIITPSISEQTAVAAGVYATGAIKVAGDSNLVAANIKKGVTIFGITGTYEGEAPTINTSTVTIRAMGTLDGTSLWSEVVINLQSLSDTEAVFAYTLTAGTQTTSGNSSAGYEKYSVDLIIEGTGLTATTTNVVVKAKSAAWSAGTTAARYTGSGTIAVPITGTATAATITNKFKTTAVSSTFSKTGTIGFY